MGTEDAINQLYTELTIHLHKGKKCIAVFQDLSKEFDLVEHKILIRKIEKKQDVGKGTQVVSILPRKQKAKSTIKGNRK